MAQAGCAGLKFLTAKLSILLMLGMSGRFPQDTAEMASHVTFRLGLFRFVGTATWIASI